MSEREFPYPYTNLTNSEIFRLYGQLPMSRIQSLIDVEEQFNEIEAEKDCSNMVDRSEVENIADDIRSCLRRIVHEGINEVQSSSISQIDEYLDELERL